MTEKNLKHEKKRKPMSKNMKSNLITYAMVVVIYIVMQILIAAGVISYHIQGMLVPVCAYVMLAVSLNLTVGILGELSLGHAGFMCLGAFSGAAFSLFTANSIESDLLRFFIALILGGIVAGVAGLLIGMPVLRLKGDYLAIVTLAFGEIIKNVVNVLYVGVDSKGVHFAINDVQNLHMEVDGTYIIKGAQGITGTPQSATFTIGIILILITLFIVLNLVQSRDGRAIMAIRDNQIAAESVGINITKYKLMAFSISAFLAGIAGAFYAHNYNNIQAGTNNFGYNMSILILVFVVLGGIGNLRGSIIAAAVLTLLPEVLRFLNDYRMLIYAVVLIIMMLFNWSPRALEFRQRISANMKAKFSKQGKKAKGVE